MTTASPSCAEISKTLSYEILMPFSWSISTSCLFLVFADTAGTARTILKWGGLTRSGYDGGGVTASRGIFVFLVTNNASREAEWSVYTHHIAV